MSHHYSGPNYGFPHGDARLDLTDVFAFPKPGDAGKSILIMDVHPQVTLAAFEATTTEPFIAEGLYELKIDTDGDYVADIAYRVQFSPFAGGAQSATVRCATRRAAVRSPTTSSTTSWPSSRTGRRRTTGSGRTPICWPSSRTWGRRTGTPPRLRPEPGGVGLR
jgi:uncharacterized protein DUF4331